MNTTDTQKKKTDSKKVFIIVASIILVFALIMSIVDSIRYFGGERLEATVIHAKYHLSGHNSKRTNDSEFTVQYHYNKQEYKSHFISNHHDYLKVGDTVTISIDKNHPTSISTSSDLINSYGLFGIAAALTVFISLLMKYRQKHPQKKRPEPEHLSLDELRERIHENQNRE